MGVGVGSLELRTDSVASDIIEGVLGVVGGTYAGRRYSKVTDMTALEWQK